MAKKLSKISQLFTVAAKHARTEKRKSQLALDELALESSTVPENILAPMPVGMGTRVMTVLWDNYPIAFFYRDEDSSIVHLNFADDGITPHVEIRNIEACRSLLTFRAVLGAIRHPDAGASLAALIRQRDAETDAMLIRAATGEASAVLSQIRL
jgi:hypothetical protein